MSAPGTLDSLDGRKILKGALVAAMGGVLAYTGTEVIPVLPEQYQFTVPCLSVLVNTLIKFLQDTQGQ